MPAVFSPNSPTGSTSAQDRWVIETIQAHLAEIVPPPLSVLEVGTRPVPRLQPHDLEAGTDVLSAMVESGGELAGIEDDEVDIAIAVGVLSGLVDESSRITTVHELLRVAPISMVVNLDWSVAEGGPAYNRLRNMVAAMLRNGQFNPYYGMLQHCEVALAAFGRGRVVTRRSQANPAAHPGLVVEMAENILGAMTGRDRAFADRLLSATAREIEAGVEYDLPDIVVSMIHRDPA